MNILVRTLSVMVGIEFLGAVILCGLRLNSTRPSPPPVEIYTDAITGAELLALPDRFLFDGPEKWRVLGETHLKMGFLHQAAACLGRAAESDPRSAEIAVIHGYCLDRLGQLDAAQEEFLRAARQGDGMARETAWYFLGRVFLQRELPTDAEEAFQRAGDKHFPSVFQRAKILLRGDRLSEVAPLLQRLAEDAPDEVRVWQLKARFAVAGGDQDHDASDAGERAHPLLWVHNLPPTLFKVNEDIGMARKFNEALQLQRAGDKLGAAQRMLELVRDDTRWQNSNPWLLQTVAAVSLEAGDLATARRLLDRQIFLAGFPTPRAWNLLGYVESLEHHPEEAGKFWRRSQFMNPAGIDYDRLSLIAEQNGDRDVARSFQGMGRQYAGIAAFRNNTLDQARSNLRQAIAIAPDLSAAWFYLGEAERSLENDSAAKAAYRRCIDLKPAHGRAHARLVRLGNHER